MNRTKPTETLSTQMKKRIELPEEKKQEGNFETMISTGSTLLDLAISGGRVFGGGIPGGIVVEIFGPSGSGKTILLCEIAGSIQRKGGEIMFHDPEARLNKQFASMFDLSIDDIAYSTPNTIPEVFDGLREWKPTSTKKINGIITDSLAALSTDLEMENKEGDKMGMRRAKEFSEELRKSARIITTNNYLMVCSNQVRENANAGPYGQKYKAPGGEAIGFYSSLRLRTYNPKKIKKMVKVAGKEVERVIGIQTEIEVFKSSIWKPYRTAPITVLLDYGIDDIRENLQFIKDFTKNTIYMIGDSKLDVSLLKSIEMIEDDNLQKKLKEEVIYLWQEIESKFESERKPKIR